MHLPFFIYRIASLPNFRTSNAVQIPYFSSEGRKVKVQGKATTVKVKSWKVTSVYRNITWLRSDPIYFRLYWIWQRSSHEKINKYMTRIISIWSNIYSNNIIKDYLIREKRNIFCGSNKLKCTYSYTCKHVYTYWNMCVNILYIYAYIQDILFDSIFIDLYRKAQNLIYAKSIHLYIDTLIYLCILLVWVIVIHKQFK